MPLIAPFEQLAEERGEQRGEQKGSLKEAQASIIDILDEKFGEVPSSLIKSVNNLENLTSLRELRRDAIKVDSLKEMKQRVKEFKNQENQ